MADLTPYFAGILESLGRPIQKAHRELVSRAGHYRRTKTGELTWVEAHMVMAHIAEHGREPNEPKDSKQSAWMGRQAMAKALDGHNIIHAMHKKEIGWVDFVQGVGDSEALPGQKPFGIRHIIDKRDAQHAADPKRYPWDGRKTLMYLPDAIAKGRIVERFENEVTIQHEGVRVSLARVPATKEEPGHAWLVSGYKSDGR